MSIKTADGHVISRNKVYYFVDGTSIRKTRCYSLSPSRFTGLGYVSPSRIYRSIERAQAELVSRYETRIQGVQTRAETLKQQTAAAIAQSRSLRGQLTKIRRRYGVST